MHLFKCSTYVQPKHHAVCYFIKWLGHIAILETNLNFRFFTVTYRTDGQLEHLFNSKNDPNTLATTRTETTATVTAVKSLWRKPEAESCSVLVWCKKVSIVVGRDDVSTKVTEYEVVDKGKMLESMDEVVFDIGAVVDELFKASDTIGVVIIVT